MLAEVADEAIVAKDMTNVAPVLDGLASDRDGSIHFQLSRAYGRTGQTELAGEMLRRSTELRAQDDALRERIRNQQITPP